MLLFNEIARFFDHQFLKEGSVNILDFFCGDNHELKDAPECTTLSWVWSDNLSHAKPCKIYQRCFWVI